MIHNSHQPDPHDADVDRALSALRSAAPPAGMEDRILQTLDARLGEPQPKSFLHSAFLRGALTGALVTATACAALFFALRAPHSTTPQTAATAHPAPIATPVALHTSDQCSAVPSSPQGSHPSSAVGANAALNAGVPHSSRVLWRDEWEGKSTRSLRLIPASFAPSRPAPPAPPTAQERALIQLVRTASPAELAALSPAAEQKADAQRQAEFEKFFAPSPEIRAIDEAEGVPDSSTGTPVPSAATPKEGSL